MNAQTFEQLYRIQDEAAKIGLTHGSEVIARIDNVHQPVPGHLKTCFIQGIQVLKVINRGDGKPLPDGVTIDKSFEMPDQQVFDPVVRIVVNGSIQVFSATKQELELAGVNS